MASSTLPSKYPRVLFLFLGVAFLAWITSAFYTLYLNPEIKLFTHGARVKIHWLHSLDTKFTNRIILFGGSSGTFSIDGELALEKFHLPIGNLSLGAGMGAKTLTRFALSEAKRGDTLLMSMEPELLANPLDVPQLATQFAIAFGRPSLADAGPALIPNSKLPIREYFATLRPGGYHFFTLIGKAIRGQPLYRYQPSDFLPSGQQETKVRLKLESGTFKFKLSPQVEPWLKELASYCATHGIKLLYALPWHYCDESNQTECRNGSARFLSEISKYIPVIYDERLGSYLEHDHFADTPYHLNRDGAKVRTEELALNLRQLKFWNTSDLALISALAQESKTPMPVTR